MATILAAPRTCPLTVPLQPVDDPKSPAASPTSTQARDTKPRNRSVQIPEPRASRHPSGMGSKDRLSQREPQPLPAPGQAIRYPSVPSARPTSTSSPPSATTGWAREPQNHQTATPQNPSTQKTRPRTPNSMPPSYRGHRRSTP